MTTIRTTMLQSAAAIMLAAFAQPAASEGLLNTKRLSASLAAEAVAAAVQACAEKNYLRERRPARLQRRPAGCAAR